MHAGTVYIIRLRGQGHVCYVSTSQPMSWSSSQWQ